MERRLEMAGGGTLTLNREGAYVRLEAQRAADGRGLYKVWLLGGQGRRILAGTLAPEDGKLRLLRRLSVGQLEQEGCWPVEGAEAVLAFSFEQKGAWYCESRPGQMVEDDLLRQLLRRPMLCRKTGEGFQLAAPFSTQRPVVLSTLLCLARVTRVEGKPHLVWSFDRAGRPRVFAGEGTGRKEDPEH